MPFPVTPQSVQAIIPSASASWCAKFLQFPLRLGYLFYNSISFMVKPNGEITDEFKTWIGLDVNAPSTAVPTGVNASSGDFTDKIRVVWTFAGSASQFKVFRSTGSDPTLATLIWTGTVNSYDDLVVPTGAPVVGQTYTYWVKATVNGVDTEFSTGDTGYAGTTTGGGGTPPPGTLISRGSAIPIDGIPITAAGNYRIEVWGGGGGGGSSHFPNTFGSGNLLPFLGPSGGGGGYVTLTVALLANDRLIGSVGRGGVGGAGSGANVTGTGEAGEGTVVALRRSGASDRGLVSAFGGGGGSGQGVAGTGGAGDIPGELLADLNPAGATVNPGTAGLPRMQVPPPIPPCPPANAGGPAGTPLPFVTTAGQGGTGGMTCTTVYHAVSGNAGAAGYFTITAVV